MNIQELNEHFQHHYGDSAEALRAFYAPGRVNLLGDHTDYNGGLVLPSAIDYGTTLLVRRRSDKVVKLASRNFNLVAFLSAGELQQKYADHWINYPLGVIDQFRQRGIDIAGLDLLYSGDIPNGAGLSSSASVEVVTAFAINSLFELGLDALTLVQMAQAAENDFVGVNCGIMDQYASAMGQVGHVMKLDCGSLACEQVPVELGDFSFLIVNSNQRRELTESKYNERFSESRAALDVLQQSESVETLAQATLEQLQTHQEALGDMLYRRARHVVSEHNAVKKAAELLRNNDLVQFGALMDQSHVSMRDDYETSTSVLDALVDISRRQMGVLGARLTGAGFGGCVVVLIESAELPEFQKFVAQEYKDSTGLSADFYPVSLADGARELSA